MLQATKTLVLDVTPDAPVDLRRRLTAEPATTMLPGGLVLEEGGSYRLEAPGGWTPVQIAGEWHFSHAAGHVVVLNDQGLTITAVR